MPLHRLTIHRHGQLLGHFDAETPWATDAVREIASRLPASEGFRVGYQVSRQERRIVDFGPHGTRVLAVEHSFAPESLVL